MSNSLQPVMQMVPGANLGASARSHRPSCIGIGSFVARSREALRRSDQRRGSEASARRANTTTTSRRDVQRGDLRSKPGITGQGHTRRLDSARARRRSNAPLGARGSPNPTRCPDHRRPRRTRRSRPQLHRRSDHDPVRDRRLARQGYASVRVWSLPRAKFVTPPSCDRVGL